MRLPPCLAFEIQTFRNYGSREDGREQVGTLLNRSKKFEQFVDRSVGVTGIV